jgi:hypothetical protein
VGKGDSHGNEGVKDVPYVGGVSPRFG